MTGFYFDEHMDRAVARALIARNITVIMAVDVKMEGKTDKEHLAYATQNDLIMVTFDHPFASQMMQEQDFLAVICLPYRFQQATGEMIDTLAEYSALFDMKKDRGQVFWST
ncbi:MAG: DUF5615 family PIN-like protein [Anaerolineae bacterium]|nr:DUF5615 family PIN-like protein [Anaerolineae bacterium]